MLLFARKLDAVASYACDPVLHMSSYIGRWSQNLKAWLCEAHYYAQVSNWYIKLPLTQCPCCTAFSPPRWCMLYTLVRPQPSNFGLSYRSPSNIVAIKW